MELYVRHYGRQELCEFLLDTNGEWRIPEIGLNNPPVLIRGLNWGPIVDTRFLGFDIFCPLHLTDWRSPQRENTFYVVATYGNDVVGVLRYISFHAEKYGKERHYALLYIDVHKNHRRKGIATALIKQWDKHWDKTMPVNICKLTKSAIEANLIHLVEKNIRMKLVPQK